MEFCSLLSRHGKSGMAGTYQKGSLPYIRPCTHAPRVCQNRQSLGLHT